MANNVGEAPLAQGFEEVQSHIMDLVPWTDSPEKTDVALIDESSGGLVKPMPLLTFLETQAVAQQEGITDEASGLLSAAGVSLVMPVTEREQTDVDRLTGWAGVSPAVARVFRLYVPHPSPDDKVLSFARQRILFVPFKRRDS